MFLAMRFWATTEVLASEVEAAVDMASYWRRQAGLVDIGKIEVDLDPTRVRVLVSDTSPVRFACFEFSASTAKR